MRIDDRGGVSAQLADLVHRSAMRLPRIATASAIGASGRPVTRLLADEQTGRPIGLGWARQSAGDDRNADDDCDQNGERAAMAADVSTPAGPAGRGILPWPYPREPAGCVRARQAHPARR
jgi:hypothetical protein